MRKSRLLMALVLAPLVVYLLPEAGAQSLLYAGAANPPPRSCTLAAGSGTVRIIAGPDTNQPDGVAATFPVHDQCPFPHSGSCLKWEYEWIYSGMNPSHSLVGVDADLQIIAAEPTAVVTSAITGDSSTGYGVNVGGEVGLRFNANAETYFARFWTKPNVSVGTTTAGFQSGNRRGFCAIAGADSTIGDSQLSTTTRITTSTLGCTINWTLRPDGCATSAEVVDGGCSVELSDLGLSTLAASCNAEVVVPGSCHLCRYDSLGRYICIVADDSKCSPHTH